MTDAEETAYLHGGRMAWLLMFQECLKHLGYQNTESKQSAWLIEREELLNQLRGVCRDFGDNDWPDDLNLSDVVEKHLADHLYQSRG